MVIIQPVKKKICLKFPDYLGPMSFFVFIPLVMVTIIVQCLELSIVVKKNRSLSVYFRFLASPADELWYEAKLDS